MTAADELIALVNKVLAQLPPGANPWAALRAALSTQIRPNLGQSFLSQLYATSAIIAVSTLLFAASLVIKWRQRTLWWFRLHRATGGVYIVPHYSSCWITGFVIFYGVLQGYLWKSISFSKGNIVYDSALWRTLVWYAGWTAFYLAAWSLPARGFLAQAPFLNAIGLLVIACSAVSIGILAGCSHIKFRSAMRNYVAIDAALNALQQSYTGKFDVASFQSGPGLAIAEKFVTELASFGTYFRWTFVSYLIWTLLLEILLVGAGVLHLRELRHTMDEMSNQPRISAESRQQEKMIEQTYNSLVYVTYGVCILLTAVNAIFAYVVAAGTKVIYIRSHAEAAGLLPPWIFAVLGLPLSILFFRRTYLTWKAAPSSASLSAAAKAELGPSTQAQNTDDSGLASILSSPGAKPIDQDGEQYPMSQLGEVPYDANAVDIPPVSPASPQSTLGAGHRGASPSIDTTESETHLFSRQYASYAARQPNEVNSVKSNSATGPFRNWRG